MPYMLWCPIVVGTVDSHTPHTHYPHWDITVLKIPNIKIKFATYEMKFLLQSKNKISTMNFVMISWSIIYVYVL